MPVSTQIGDRRRLLLVAVGVALLLLPLIWASVVFVPRQYTAQISWKWTRFVVVTIFFVVYCLKTYWRARRHLRFWAILLGVFLIHFLGVGYFYYAGPGLPLVVFGPTVALEWALLALSVYHVLGIGPPAARND